MKSGRAEFQTKNIAIELYIIILVIFFLLVYSLEVVQVVDKIFSQYIGQTCFKIVFGNQKSFH
jgi:hypothetical protein